MKTAVVLASVALAAALVGGCEVRPPCHADEDCPVEAYCHSQHQVCFKRPPAPHLRAIEPGSPSRQQQVTVRGDAPVRDEVTVHDDAACESEPLGSATVDENGLFTIPVTVSANQETRLYAHARSPKGEGFSQCSGGLSFTHDDRAPTIVSQSPGADASTVSPLDPITLVFDEPMAPASLSTAFHLSSDGGVIAGALQVDGGVLVFSPDRPLVYGATYSVQLADGGTDLAGNPLGDQDPWSFIVRERRWDGPLKLTPSPDDLHQAGQKAVVDREGRVTVLWLQLEGQKSNVWSRRFTERGGWEPPVLVGTSDLGESSSLQVAQNQNGEIVATWLKNDGLRDNVWAASFRPDAGWGAPTLVEQQNARSASAPAVAIDRQGKAAVVWPQSNGTKVQVWAALRPPTGEWASPELLGELTDGGLADGTAVAFFLSGDALALWTEREPGLTRVRASGYVNPTGWSPQSTMAVIDGGSVSALTVLSVEDDLRLITWAEGGADEHAISVLRRYPQSHAWLSPRDRVTPVPSNYGYPVVAQDGAGHSYAAWSSWNYTGPSFAEHEGSVWTAPAFLDGPDAPSEMTAPALVSDRAGNLIAAWAMGPDEVSLRTKLRQRKSGQAWGDTVELRGAPDVGFSPLAPVLATNPDGTAVVVWADLRPVSGLGDIPTLFVSLYH